MNQEPHTPKELDVLSHLVDAWNNFTKLEVEHSIKKIFAEQFMLHKQLSLFDWLGELTL